MALYSFKAVNSQGETEEGIKNALDQQTVLAELQSQGFIPINIELAKDKTFLGIKLGSSAVSL